MDRDLILTEQFKEAANELRFIEQLQAYAVMFMTSLSCALLFVVSAFPTIANVRQYAGEILVLVSLTGLIQHKQLIKKAKNANDRRVKLQKVINSAIEIDLSPWYDLEQTYFPKLMKVMKKYDTGEDLLYAHSVLFGLATVGVSIQWHH